MSDNYDIGKLQKVDLEIAKYFVKFCNDNNLLCYFCGGGCIGTIRHQGFIPWDDDLDFFMPRESYEKLKTIWKDNDDYALIYPTKEYNDHNMFITLRYKKTTMIKTYQEDMDIVHGVNIDIFPLDGCPANKIKRKIQLFWALIYQLYCSQMVPRNHGGMIALVGKMALGFVRSPYNRYRVWKYAEKKMSQYKIADCQYVTELCAGPRYMKNEYPKEFFENAIFKKFEDTQMPIPEGYDGYLKMAFGNYMELPPVEQRKAMHDAFIDLDNPYPVYKGKRYLVNE